MDYITQPQIAQQQGVTPACIYKRAEKLGIQAKCIRTAKSGRLNLYKLDDAIKLGWVPNHQVNQDHSLVKDERWLRLNEWPDPLPACFQDLEDD